MRVFIVDDSLLIRKRLSALVAELENMEVVGQGRDVAGSAKAIQELRPDAVILDIRLSGGSGLDILEAIKGGERPPAVIIVTNYPYPQYRKKARDLGAEYFFDKSVEFEKIAGALEEIRATLEEKGRDVPPGS